MAYDRWRPSPGDTCTAEIHNSHAVIGPDGKRYPTWHPPVDSVTGCSFGHEHGRDPRGSHLFDEIGPLAFGYVNEQLAIADPSRARHEDHVGHKIEWENAVPMIQVTAGSPSDLRCDILTKLHQGTHSGDAFTNNLHELDYAIDCTDGTRMRLRLLTAIGTPGEFLASCDGRRIVAGIAAPANAPAGGGQRSLPDRQCVERFMLVPPGEGSNFHSALHESWDVQARIQAADGRVLASVDAYFGVSLPSRYFDPAQPGQLGRSVDACTEVTASGHRAEGAECARSTGDGRLVSVAFDDHRSAFNGVRRTLDINGNRITNAAGPEVWYTDAFGGHARTAPFPGSIRQVIARIDNAGRVVSVPQIGRRRAYGGPGVHAPN